MNSAGRGMVRQILKGKITMFYQCRFSTGLTGQWSWIICTLEKQENVYFRGPCRKARKEAHFNRTMDNIINQTVVVWSYISVTSCSTSFASMSFPHASFFFTFIFFCFLLFWFGLLFLYLSLFFQIWSCFTYLFIYHLSPILIKVGKGGKKGGGGKRGETRSIWQPEICPSNLINSRNPAYIIRHLAVTSCFPGESFWIPSAENPT